MDLKKILITGGSGILGTQIILECDPVRILTPTREEMDITSLESVCSYFNNNDFDLMD